MKRVLTIQDISCLGRCSTTVTLPVLSAMGIETVLLPTALLSTHTMFENPFRMDLSDQMDQITAHWRREQVHFDAIITGYLGTEKEIGQVIDVIREFRREDTFVFVDPVMGDHGRLYSGFDMAYAKRNLELCKEADMIVPNLTEACLMTDIPYQEEYDEAYIRGLLKELAGRMEKLPEGAASPARTGKQKVIAVTGVSFSEGKTGVMGEKCSPGDMNMADAEEGSFLYQTDKVPAVYHGTGDLFSAVTAGAIINGQSWQEALCLAAEHTALTIRETIKEHEDARYGVAFEKTLYMLKACCELS